MIPGEEVSFYDKKTGVEFHLIALNLRELVVGSDCSGMSVQEVIDLLKKRGTEAIIVHPYCVGDAVIDIIDLEGIISVEIFNS